MSALVEIYHTSRWHPAATFEPANPQEQERGFRGRSHFSYEFDDAVGTHLDAADFRAVSCRYPVSLELHSDKTWPAFFLDLLPAGAGRLSLIRRLGLRDNAAADWPLLLQAHAPIGNVRLAIPAGPTDSDHKGSH